MLRRVNLIPKTPLAARIKRLTPWLLTLLLIGIVAGVGGRLQQINQRITHLDHEIRQLERQTSRSDQLAKLLQERSAQLKQHRQQLVTLTAQVTTLQRRFTAKRSFSRLLASISNALPPSARCDRIEIQAASGTVSGVAMEYRRLPEMVHKLEQDPLFSKVSLTALDRADKDPWGRFRFTLLLELR